MLLKIQNGCLGLLGVDKVACFPLSLEMEGLSVEVVANL
jgi:hypothetical protein